MPLDRHAKKVLDFLAATSGGQTAPLSSAERRQTLRALSEGAETSPAPVGWVKDLSIRTSHGTIGLRIYQGANAPAGPSPALVYFHGGGWVAGDLDTHESFCRRLANAAACQVIAVDYRLAPEHRFPAALEDCLSAFRWAVENAQPLGLQPGRIGVGGDSTGAGLAAAASLVLRDCGGPNPALQLLVCPVLDSLRSAGSRLSFRDGYFVDRAVFEHDLYDYCAAEVDPRDWRVSPLLANDFAGLPPAVVHTAEFDPFRDEGLAYAEALMQCGVAARAVQHAGMIHYFYAIGRAIPYATIAAQAIGADVCKLFQESDG